MNVFVFSGDFAGHRSLFCEAADEIANDGDAFIRFEDLVFDEAKERELFEALWPVPSDCIWCGNGYAATEFNAWLAHEYVQRWKGWIACAKSRATR